MTIYPNADEHVPWRDSTSIFWQLYRLILGLRNGFAFHDELRWVGAYGVLETVRKHLLGAFVHFPP